MTKAPDPITLEWVVEHHEAWARYLQEQRLVLAEPRSGLDPIGLLRDLCSPAWHDCTCDVHEAARYYLTWLDREPKH